MEDKELDLELYKNTVGWSHSERWAIIKEVERLRQPKTLGESMHITQLEEDVEFLENRVKQLCDTEKENAKLREEVEKLRKKLEIMGDKFTHPDRHKL